VKLLGNAHRFLRVRGVTLPATSAFSDPNKEIEPPARVEGRGRDAVAGSACDSGDHRFRRWIVVHWLFIVAAVLALIWLISLFTGGFGRSGSRL
jgi:hypothetical protein